VVGAQLYQLSPVPLTAVRGEIIIRVSDIMLWHCAVCTCVSCCGILVNVLSLNCFLISKTVKLFRIGCVGYGFVLMKVSNKAFKA